MKRFFLSLLTTVSLLATAYATANCCPCVENSKPETEKTTLLREKRYIKPEQIILLTDKILVQVDDDLMIEARAIYRDCQGFYFDDDDECDQSTGYRWECLICRYCNPFWQKCCIRCDRDRKGDRCK